MKVLQFTVPGVQGGSVVVQVDVLSHFYNYFHRHTEAQITLILKGEGTLIAGNYTQPFKAGELYILGANQPHIFKSEASYFESHLSGAVHAIHIYFNGDDLSEAIFKLPELKPLRRFIQTTSNGLQLPKAFYTQAAAMVQKITAATGMERLLQFVQLLYFFATEVKEWKLLSTGFSRNAFSDTEGMRINDIYQYTIDHHAEKISLKTVAEMAHVTTHAFCKYFKKHTRKTYMGFLNEIRISEACKKMINGNFDSIATVAYAVGFNNPITFNRVFKRITGITPTEYLNNYKSKNV